MSWLEMLEKELDSSRDRIRRYEKLRTACTLLDSYEIPSKSGSLWASTYGNSITIQDATEELVPKLVKIKDSPVTKYFDEYGGKIGYRTSVGGVKLEVVPDKEKYVCKVSKQTITTREEVESSYDKYTLQGDCDPLFFEEATKEEVGE